MIGRTLSHYKVLEKIGEGGKGEIYLANRPQDTRLEGHNRVVSKGVRWRLH